MKKINNPFLECLPTIDLHGTEYEYACYKTKEFINENIFFRNYKIVIVHGKSGGIIKEAVHKTLKENKNVIEFYLDSFNLGSTVAVLEKR